MVRPLPRKKENVSSNLITGSNFMNEELTEEKIHYVNYSLLDICDGCHDYFPITNYNDGENYLTWVGKHLYCQKCMADSSNGKTRVS